MNTSFLELENISFTFGHSKTKIFDNLSLNIDSKENLIAILGSNGSGKTLLAKLITGLEKNNRGSIRIFGKDITKLKTRDRLRYVSMAFQMVNNTFLKQTVDDEINYTKEIAENLKKELNFEDSKLNTVEESLINKLPQHPLTLSGGEKRKLHFHLLRILNPDIYILDEPTVGLDYYGLQELKNEILTLSEKGKKVIIITHNLKFLLSLTDYVIILEKNPQTELSSILYQGSLHWYLLNRYNEAKIFLSVPIEYDLFRKKIFFNELPFDTTFNEFLYRQKLENTNHYS